MERRARSSDSIRIFFSSSPGRGYSEDQIRNYIIQKGFTGLRRGGYSVKVRVESVGSIRQGSSAFHQLSVRLHCVAKCVSNCRRDQQKTQSLDFSSYFFLSVWYVQHENCDHSRHYYFYQQLSLHHKYCWIKVSSAQCLGGFDLSTVHHKVQLIW